jgi:hypothetical protein
VVRAHQRLEGGRQGLDRLLLEVEEYEVHTR